MSDDAQHGVDGAHETPLYQGHGREVDDYADLGPAPEEVGEAIAAIICYQIMENPIQFVDDYHDYIMEKRRKKRRDNHAAAEGLA